MMADGIVGYYLNRLCAYSAVLYEQSFSSFDESCFAAHGLFNR